MTNQALAPAATNITYRDVTVVANGNFTYREAGEGRSYGTNRTAARGSPARQQNGE